MPAADRLLNNFSGIRQVADAAGLLVTGRIAGAGANFAFAVILARMLPPAEVGAAFAAISTAFLASVVVTLNVESGSIRFLVAARQAGREDILHGFIVFGRLILICAAPIAMAAYIAVSLTDGPQHHTFTVIFTAASIPVIGWLRLSGAHATALGKPVAGSLPRTALQPALLVIFFSVAIFAGAPATASAALGCFFAAFLLTAVVQFLLLRRPLQAVSANTRRFDDWRNWMLNGFYMSPIILLQEYLQHSIVLAAALTLPPDDVAVLAIALRFVSLLRFGVLSVNMAASPRISHAIARKDNAERDRQLRTAALLKGPPTMLAAAIIIFIAEPILSIFGAEYAGNSRILACFTLIPLATAILGPNQMLLNISGARGWLFGVSLVAVAALFTAVPVLAATFHIGGAAVAAVFVYAAWELVLFCIVRMKLNIDGSLLSIFKVGR